MATGGGLAVSPAWFSVILTRMSAERILVIEDDRVVMKVLTRMLASEGYQVLSAPNGTAAIGVVRASAVDLILLDLTLIDDDSFGTSWDGFGLLDWLRRMLPGLSAPIIIHTIKTSPALEARAREKGVRAVFQKGGDPKQLMAAVRQALDEKSGKQAA